MPVPPLPVGPFAFTWLGDALPNEIIGSNSADLIYGGDSNDALSGRRGNDYIDGGAGNDLIAGGRDTDTLIGGTGNDQISSGGGADLMFGGDGNDVLTIDMTLGSGQEAYGGIGSDAFVLTGASSGFSVTLGDFTFGEDVLTVNGASFLAIATAGAGFTALDGGGVSVFLPSLGGTLVLSGTSVTSVVQAIDLAGNDTFTGSSGDDYFEGEGGNDLIDGGGADDLLGGGDGNDLIEGGSGSDTLGGDRGNDSLYGGDGDDAIYGRFGNNLIYGGGGDDVISTGRDNSTVFGGSGDDFISARLETAGDHVLTGGAGADTFDFFGSKARKISDSVITDFEVGVDTFTINSVDGFQYAADYGLEFYDGPDGAVLVLQTGSSITFEGVSATELGAILPPELIS